MAEQNDPWFSVEAQGVDSDHPIAFVRGEVDIVSAPELSGLVTELVNNGPHTLVIDLSGTTFMGAAGVRIIADARRVMPEGCPIILRRPTPFIRKVLEITGMDEICVIED